MESLEAIPTMIETKTEVDTIITTIEMDNDINKTSQDSGNNETVTVSEREGEGEEDNCSENENVEETFHTLSDKWTLWAHLPHDTDWSLSSYQEVLTFGSIEEGIALCETLPEKMVKNCMLFLMKENIKPTWEDPKNINGGSFSFKVSNKLVYDLWNKLFYVTIGKTISKDKGFTETVNGITISPKKNFCIMKIWTNNCTKQNPELIDQSQLKSLNVQSCLFKKHIPSC